MTIFIVGAGSLGCALAVSLSRQGNSQISLITHTLAQADSLRQNRQSPRLPGFVLPTDINIVASEELLAQNGNNCHAKDTKPLVILCVPTSAITGVISSMEGLMQTSSAVVLTAKGLLPDALLFPHQLAARALSSAGVKNTRIALLSGPSFAAELAAFLPAALTVSAESIVLARSIADRLHRNHLRLYPNDDPNAVAVLGAFKNILALAAGISDGLQQGENARAALITRGMNDIARCLPIFNGRRETLHSLAGFGDILLTCTSRQSRNYQAGIALAAGEPLPSIRRRLVTIEGLDTSIAARKALQKHGITAPVITAVADIVAGELAPAHAIRELMQRPPRSTESD